MTRASDLLSKYYWRCLHGEDVLIERYMYTELDFEAKKWLI